MELFERKRMKKMQRGQEELYFIKARVVIVVVVVSSSITIIITIILTGVGLSSRPSLR